jgi:hypothetical protein
MDVQLAWYPWLTVRDNVALPLRRTQITTKQLPEFVRLRTEVSRLVRGRAGPFAPGNRRSRSLSRTTPVPAPAPPLPIVITASSIIISIICR